MATYKKQKFRFSETFMNTNGKTSGSGFIGVILGLIAAAAFIAAMVGWFLQVPDSISVMSKILEVSFVSGALMGVRKMAPRFGRNEPNDGIDDKKEGEVVQKG